jgi:hypothetical protein
MRRSIESCIGKGALGASALGLAMLAGLGVGCGGGGGPAPSPPACLDGAIHFSWDLTEQGQPVGCAPGDQVEIDADAMNQVFPCADLSDTTDPVAGGTTYSVSFTLLDANNATVSTTTSMNVHVPCDTTADVGEVSFDVP